MSHGVHALPVAFALKQNMPNPFNMETVISFDLPDPTDLTLTIFNAAGQRIQQWQGYWPGGYHSFTWNGQDEDGASVASGVCFYRVEAGDFAEMKRMTLLR